MSPDNQDSKTQVILAIIAVTGTLGAALIANWDKIFPKPPEPSPHTFSPSPLMEHK